MANRYIDGSVIIRPAHPSDAIGIKSVEASSGLSGWTARDYAKMADDRAFLIYVAVGEQEILGFFAARLITQTKLAGLKFGDEVEAEILNVAVSEFARRKGIGTALLRKLLGKLAEFGRFSVFLEVRASNAEALGFYRKIGFGETGRRVGYYQKPEDDAILMTFS